MRGTLLLYLLFAAAAAVALREDRLEPASNRLTALLRRAPAPGGAADPGDESVAALEARALELERLARRYVPPASALAGTEAAFAGLLARLGDLEAEVGESPAAEIGAKLDFVERDFEIREQMVRNARDVSGSALPDWRKECAALEEEVAALEDAPVARVAAVEAVLARVRASLPGRGDDATRFLDAAASARSEFDRRVAALRARLDK